MTWVKMSGDLGGVSQWICRVLETGLEINRCV